ncbi:hypothetical protein [Desulfosoma sp.]
MARMTVRTAAQALGVSPDTLEEYLERTGKMESIRQGKRVFIPAHLMVAPPAATVTSLARKRRD